ncbi:MAG: biotin-dependent carboxyltransferase family protein [Sandaracinaceae bacterium]|nr:biotin-dependent carboxyltransferase family protein [Sandaracinaceae bacterium]
MTLRIVQSVGLCTVQDHGRESLLHRGIARGGALVRSLYEQANANVGNTPFAAAIEVLGKLVVEALNECTVATDDAKAQYLAAGQRYSVETKRDKRASYFAVRGGIDVPVRLGSRSTLLSAQFGGYEGRSLKKGDEVCVLAGATAVLSARTEEPALVSSVRIVYGPDADAFDSTALSSLLEAEWIVASSSDRVGTRLHGPILARVSVDRRPSMPMIYGAIEVPGDGQPVVLGPEHPITGGYPILAVVCADSTDAFFARPPGAAVRFVR